MKNILKFFGVFMLAALTGSMIAYTLGILLFWLFQCKAVLQ